MASTTELRMLLFRIRQQLTAHPVFVRGKGVPVDDPARPREIAELEKLGLQLSLAIRELQNRTNSLGVRAQNLWNVPHKDRFSAAASIRSQQADVDEVLKLANDLNALLQDMLRRSGLIGEGELSQGVGELIEKLFHQATMHGEVPHMPRGLAYSKPVTGQFAGSLEGATILAFMALHAYLYVLKRGGKTAGR